MKRFRPLLALAVAAPLALSLSAWTAPAPSLSSTSSLSGSSVLPNVDATDPADNLPSTFDLQSHRFGRGEWTEQSELGLTESLTLDVTTLEFDVVVAADGTPVVWHDPVISDTKCTDTEPVTADDPDFPYVGKVVNDLTWEQLQTLNCNVPLSAYPDALHPETNRLLQLNDVFELAGSHEDVHFNIETKRDYNNPEHTASPQEFVDAVLPVVHEHGVEDRTMIQSFDWATLAIVRAMHPDIPTVVLTGGPLTPDAAYLGPVDVETAEDNFGAAQQLGAQVISPAYREMYFNDAGEVDLPKAAAYVEAAHAHGLRVVPYTVNDAAIMEDLIDVGVDGLITDYPTTLVEILTGRDIEW